ncbi:fumarylacetoacetate hydrolase family protein [Halorubellus sp. JP-L1]|uniref:fumarylacetoacetate hydrolase family protein n=1 Tax=Halorubellus sp. JP-L1 TaxID=2715753 RepID=UPI0014082D36|nr:fumarylacetoacetate hydrolase family protein [Halorubellus sp. JP-L1]NHN40366.1 fumarylacetoacetate hydrolase family protein [Halorubellus sp. JP-L1]
MKHVRFRDPAGAIRRGTWHDDGTVSFADQRYDREAVDVLAPTEPSKVVCVGRNYVEHADEMDSDVPDRPLLFLKPPNAVASHGSDVRLPAGKDRLDFEAELGVVVGEQASHLDVDSAMDAVAGFTCVNDLSNRDDQREETNWVRGKAFDGAAPIGPVVATPDEVPDDAYVRSYLNGDRKQDGSLDQMVFSVPELLAEITTYLTLEPGDVVATGTPAGVGRLEDGDAVRVEVEGVGALEHTVSVPGA